MPRTRAERASESRLTEVSALTGRPGVSKVGLGLSLWSTGRPGSGDSGFLPFFNQTQLLLSVFCPYHFYVPCK